MKKKKKQKCSCIFSFWIAIVCCNFLFILKNATLQQQQTSWKLCNNAAKINARNEKIYSLKNWKKNKGLYKKKRRSRNKLLIEREKKCKININSTLYFLLLLCVVVVIAYYFFFVSFIFVFRILNKLKHFFFICFVS